MARTVIVSEFAHRLTQKLFRTPNSHYESIIDQELQEVREVITLAANPKFTTDGSGAIRYYLTKSDVEAARKLLNQFEVKA